MMVERTHLENPLAGKFEADDLRDHRESLDDEDDSDQRQEEQDVLLDRDECQQRAEGKRPGIAHEDLRWMPIVAKEYDHRRSDGETGPASIECEKHEERRECDRRRESVDAIGEIYC